MRRLISVGITVAALLMAGGATGLVAPALACGNAPGLCPSPPGPDAPIPDGGYVGTGSDF